MEKAVGCQKERKWWRCRVCREGRVLEERVGVTRRVVSQDEVVSRVEMCVLREVVFVALERVRDWTRGAWSRG